jgi:hypothetical protein
VGAPLFGVGWTFGRPVVAIFGVLLLLVGIVISCVRTKCPSCKKTLIQIGVKFSHCPRCGAAFDGPAD